MPWHATHIHVYEDDKLRFSCRSFSAAKSIADRLNALDDIDYACACGHLASHHTPRTHEVERGDHYCPECSSIHDLEPVSARELRHAEALLKSVFNELHSYVYRKEKRGPV